jgi:MFS family permease
VKQGNLLGLINTSYSIGAIVSGWFIGGPTVSALSNICIVVVDANFGQADYLGRRWGMGIGCFITVIATLIQAFAPRHQVGVFILGRVIIGIGQGMALSN